MLVLRGIRPDTAPDGLGRVRWRRGAAVTLAAATVLVLASCSSSPVAESTVKATQAAVATVEATPSSNETTTPPSKYETMNQTGVFSPEALSKLSAAELTALFQIKQSEAPTGAVYAEVLGQRIEAWDNAGGTKAEWLPYKNAAKGTYETALAEKYNNPIAEGVLGHDGKPEAQELILNRRNVMYILGKELVYTVDYVEGSVVVTPQPDGSENISAEYAYTDNFGEAKKVLGGGVETDAAHFTLRWNLNEVRANADGVLYPSTNNATVVTQ